MACWYDNTGVQRYICTVVYVRTQKKCTIHTVALLDTTHQSCTLMSVWADATNHCLGESRWRALPPPSSRPSKARQRETEGRLVWVANWVTHMYRQAEARRSAGPATASKALTPPSLYLWRAASSFPPFSWNGTGLWGNLVLHGRARGEGSWVCRKDGRRDRRVTGGEMQHIRPAPLTPIWDQTSLKLAHPARPTRPS